MLVLDDINQLDAVLDGWQAVGVTGATIFNSTGLHRRRAQIREVTAIDAPRIIERIENATYNNFCRCCRSGSCPALFGCPQKL